MEDCWQMLSLPDATLARLGIYYNYYTGSDDSALESNEKSRRHRFDSDRK